MALELFMQRPIVFFSPIVAAVALASCAGHGSPITPLNPPKAAQIHRESQFLACSTLNDLYINLTTSPSQGTVTTHAITNGDISQTSAGSVDLGSDPSSLIVDGGGSLYIGSTYAVNKLSCAFSGGQFTGQFSDPNLFGASALALDQFNDLFVATSGADHNSPEILVFHPDNPGTAYQVISLPNFTSGIAATANGTLYVADQTVISQAPLYGQISIYAPGSSSPTAYLGGPTDNIGVPIDVKVDSSGNIYVLTNNHNAGLNPRIMVFPAGSTGDATASDVIAGSATTLTLPTKIYVDRQGNISVLDVPTSGSANVDYFPAGSNGNVAPASSLANLSFWSGAFIGGLSPSVCLPSPKLLVSTSQSPNSGSVQEFSPEASGDASPLSTINISGVTPSAVAMDQAGNIYVGAGSYLTLYGCAGQAPEYNASFQDPNLYGVSSIALDGNSHVYAVTSGADHNTPQILEFRASGGNSIASIPVQSLATKIDVTPDGTIYAADQQVTSQTPLYGQVKIFAPGSSSPTATLGGPSDGIGTPWDVKLDGAENIYVLTNDHNATHNPRVMVFPAMSNGDAAASAVIEGSLTQLVSPIAIAVDAGGGVYVADKGNASTYSIYYFAPGANGNVAPTRTITGISTWSSFGIGL
jgi:hypothetical protein